MWCNLRWISLFNIWTETQSHSRTHTSSASFRGSTKILKKAEIICVSAALVKISLTRYVVSSWESNTWHSSMCRHFPFFGKLPFTDFDWWDLIETWILWNSAPYKQMVDKQIRKWLTMWLNLRISIDTMSLACGRPSRAAGGYNCPSSYHTLITTTKRVQPHLQKEVALVEEVNTFMAWWAGCAQASSRPVRSMWNPPERLARELVDGRHSFPPLWLMR